MRRPKRILMTNAKARPSNDRALREHLLYLLGGGGAHVSFDDAITGVPADVRGQKPAGMDHSVWELVEHIRIAQWDILEFSRDRKHQSPKWPEGYWPSKERSPSTAQWNASVKKIRADLKAMQALVRNPKTDLFAKIPWGDGQTVLREALLVADHNAYHVAQIVDVRRLLGVWGK